MKLHTRKNISGMIIYKEKLNYFEAFYCLSLDPEKVAVNVSCLPKLISKMLQKE